jgi:hypothetical protein
MENQSVVITIAKKNSRFRVDTVPIVVYIENCSMDTITKWAGEQDRTREPILGREATRRPLRFTHHVSRFTFHANVAAELHHSCTVSSPIFDFAFHYLLSLNHLQNQFPKLVQFLACRAEALGEGGLTLLASPTCHAVLSSVGLAEEEASAQRRAHTNAPSASRQRPPAVTYGHQ